MKKVWILEMFYTREDLERGLQSAQELYEKELAKADRDMKTVNAYIDVVLCMKRDIEENPEGVWSGIEGKTNYAQFCDVAKDALRRAKDGASYRVVQAQIPNTATQWWVYQKPVVNDGVYRYLMATK